MAGRGALVIREPLEGELVDVSLANVLTHLGTGEATGILTLRLGRILKKLCFVGGQVRFVASNIREERLAEHLLDRNLIDEAAAAALTADGGVGNRPGRRLVEMGALDEKAAIRALQQHILTIVKPCLGWIDGTFRFDPGLPNLGDEVGAAVAVEDLILVGSRKASEDAAEVEAMLGSRDRPLAAVPGAREQLERLDLEPIESFLVELADGKRTAADLVGACAVDAETAAKALFVIMRAGLVVDAARPAPRTLAAPAVSRPVPRAAPPAATSAGATSAAAAPDDLPDRREVEHLISRAEGDDLPRILGVEPDVEGEPLRAAYVALASRFHPDRFREGPCAELHEGLEAAFARLTEAYQILADPAARKEYERRRRAGAPRTDSAALAAENYRRGRALLEAGKRVEALRFLENAVRLDPTAPDYRRDLGLLQAQNPRLRREAEENLREVLRSVPADALARVGLGLVLRRLGRDDEAIAQLEETLRWEPGDAAALASLGRGPVTPELRRGLLGPLLVG